ncbi:uncharacterized protein LOC123322665 [Coccinella septempunctata]|uniref:uncharacterized protein LOC123322665 n=1 Tax=Coccinella septempunctata TaxID=41139 RepID=UPI001D07C2D6|nr:uncharacterized protein LOC123322665 [Coccinella septempunctata]
MPVDLYNEKAQTQLNEQDTYKKLSKDPTTSIQNKLNKLVALLHKRGHIDDATLKFLKCNNGTCPKLYFLPKVHKTDCPLRPIVSYVGSPLYNLSKFLAELLINVFEKDEKYVKDSFQFVEDLANVSIPENFILVSLDVSSLFTNIPIELAVELVRRHWSKVEPHTRLTVDEFVQLFEFCVDNSYFVFNDQFFCQVFGLGMGNCLAPIVSDIVMSDLQNSALSALPFRVPIYKRYVDDIFTSIPSDGVGVILDAFNSFHPRLQFTLETERNNSLPFLDVRVIRSSGCLRTDWYRKPTFSERFLNFNSQHPFTHKINLIENLKFRATHLASTEFHVDNMNKIKSFLIKNNYPVSLIRRILNKNDSTHLKPLLTTAKRYFKIPYIQGLSERVSQLLRDQIVEIAFKPANTVGGFYSKLKSKTALGLRSGVIYSIPCRECNKVYIGQTNRYLRTRLTEHKRDCVNIHNPTKMKDNNTALAEHSFNELHSFDFDSVKILHCQTNLSKRLFCEMLEIKKEVNSLNKRSDIENLNTAYFNIIQRIRNLTS